MRSGAWTAAILVTTGLVAGTVRPVTGAAASDTRDPCREMRAARTVMGHADLWTRFDLTRHSSVYILDCIVAPRALETLVKVNVPPPAGCSDLVNGVARRMPDMIAALVDRRVFPVVERRAPRVGERGLVVQIEIQQYAPWYQLGFVVRLRSSEGDERIPPLSSDVNWVVGGGYGFFLPGGSFSVSTDDVSYSSKPIKTPSDFRQGFSDETYLRSAWMSSGVRALSAGHVLTLGDSGPLIVWVVDSARTRLDTHSGSVAVLRSDSSIPSVAMRCAVRGRNGAAAECGAAAQVAAWLSLCKGVEASAISAHMDEARHAAEPVGPHGIVQFVRRKSIRSGSSAKVAAVAEIDGVCLGMLDRGGVLTAYVAPGAHKACLFREGHEEVRPVQVEAGKTYVLDVEFTLVAASLSKAKESSEDQRKSFCDQGAVDLTGAGVQGQ